MDTRFKWNMFITSFIPLWISIILSDMWDIVKYIALRWYRLSQNIDVTGAVIRFFKANGLMTGSILIIGIIVMISIVDINVFLYHKEAARDSPTGKLVKVARANKLSAEFLLAYILPMIAFDFSDGKSEMLFVLYFLVLAYLCIRNNNVYTNIYLETKKYRMYECTVECRVANGAKVYENSFLYNSKCG